jgi:hypothetical protein
MAISEREREYRREHRKKHYGGQGYRNVVPQIPKTDESELARLLGEIPKEDVRTLTARLCGDPNPADRRRSA